MFQFCKSIFIFQSLMNIVHTAKPGKFKKCCYQNSNKSRVPEKSYHSQQEFYFMLHKQQRFCHRYKNWSHFHLRCPIILNICIYFFKFYLVKHPCCFSLFHFPEPNSFLKQILNNLCSFQHFCPIKIVYMEICKRILLLSNRNSGVAFYFDINKT